MIPRLSAVCVSREFSASCCESNFRDALNCSARRSSGADCVEGSVAREAVFRIASACHSRFCCSIISLVVDWPLAAFGPRLGIILQPVAIESVSSPPMTAGNQTGREQACSDSLAPSLRMPGLRMPEMLMQAMSAGHRRGFGQSRDWRKRGGSVAWEFPECAEMKLPTPPRATGEFELSYSAGVGTTTRTGAVADRRSS